MQGNILQYSGNPSEALNSYGKALEFDSSDPSIYFNIGNNFLEVRDMPKRAEIIFWSAYKFDPDYWIGSLICISVLYSWLSLNLA